MQICSKKRLYQVRVLEYSTEDPFLVIFDSVSLLSLFFLNSIIFGPKLSHHHLLILFYSFDIIWVSCTQPWHFLHSVSISCKIGQTGLVSNRLYMAEWCAAAFLSKRRALEFICCLERIMSTQSLYSNAFPTLRLGVHPYGSEPHILRINNEK